MIPDKYSLDEIRGHTKFGFVNTYQLHSDGIDDSPFSKISRSCKYIYPNNFKGMENHSKNTNSYFRLNCRGLSNNRDSFTELLRELRSESFSFYFI